MTKAELIKNMATDAGMVSFDLIKVGDSVKFVEERKPYKVHARNERYLICKKPFNLWRTYQYTIVDLVDAVRGSSNMIRGFDVSFETDQDCIDRLADLVAGDIEVSRRNQVPLEIEMVKQSNQS